MIDAEAALRQALLDALVKYPRHMHKSKEDLTDAAWEYLQAADRAHPAVAAVLREAAEKLAG
ncbi:hypothetical protein [Paracoccus benzoatiresistens]|uniref:Uncharacterized protein n=1 Tax=Paracoccus benzoatiresistens TaxID=2997341 RepID=A0ABT4JDI4_9RHOB|nr:hypothetical protein [Paracoccus sp. EF6]MCZ0964601.1 hypothetical protein [Paracoccus sp. EF6]